MKGKKPLPNHRGLMAPFFALCLLLFARQGKPPFRGVPDLHDPKVRVVQLCQDVAGGLLRRNAGVKIDRAAEDRLPFQIQGLGQAEEAAAQRTEVGCAAQSQLSVHARDGEEATASYRSRLDEGIFQVFCQEKNLFDACFFRLGKQAGGVRIVLFPGMEMYEGAHRAEGFGQVCQQRLDMRLSRILQFYLPDAIG